MQVMELYSFKRWAKKRARALVTISKKERVINYLRKGKEKEMPVPFLCESLHPNFNIVEWVNKKTVTCGG